MLLVQLASMFFILCDDWKTLHLWKFIANNLFFQVLWCFFILKVYIQRIKYGIYKMAGLQISTGYQTKSDVKTVVSNAKSPYTWQSWPTCFWVVKNTLLTMQDIILLCLHYLLFYSFLILFMILHVFFSSNIGCHSYKEFFDYSFMYKFSSTL